MEDKIAPFMYSRVCKQLDDDTTNPERRKNPLNYDFSWIDCWAGCASVIVDNANEKVSIFGGTVIDSN